MIIDATFWVAVSFLIFCGLLVYLKVPGKINALLNSKIDEIKTEINEAEKIKEDSSNMLNNYENKIRKAQEESKNIINGAKKESEKMVIENTEKFYQQLENSKKLAEQRMSQMKMDTLKEIKNASVKITLETVENLIKNSIDKNKLDKLYQKNLDQIKIALKKN